MWDPDIFGKVTASDTKHYVDTGTALCYYVTCQKISFLIIVSHRGYFWRDNLATTKKSLLILLVTHTWLGEGSWGEKERNSVLCSIFTYVYVVARGMCRKHYFHLLIIVETYRGEFWPYSYLVLRRDAVSYSSVPNKQVFYIFILLIYQVPGKCLYQVSYLGITSSTMFLQSDDSAKQKLRRRWLINKHHRHCAYLVLQVLYPSCRV